MNSFKYIIDVVKKNYKFYRLVSIGNFYVLKRRLIVLFWWSFNIVSCM